jgi:Sugar transferases involved in lipopolysaccharide synthesis
MATLPRTEASRYIAPSPRRVSARASRAASSPLAVGILEEHYFLHLLRLQRKRTERSREPFMLMLLDVEGLIDDAVRARSVRHIMFALGSSVRDTDTLGWYEYDRKMGVIFSEIGSEPMTNAALIMSKVNGALQGSLRQPELHAIDVTFRLFPEDSEVKKEADLTLYPDLSERHEKRAGAQLAKRTLDVFGSILGISALAPLFALVALLVKLSSPGPVLFRQKRVGRYGKTFTFLKFRSMYMNNDSKIHQEYVARLIEGKADSKPTGDGKAGVYKLTNDPRITAVGRFLRKSSLDELPQLFNVLLGTMSLVGPRPPVPYEFERYDIWHRRRVLEVKPGITGLWQVFGRSKTTFDEMVRLDLAYAKRWSVWLDLKILLRTPMVVFLGDGAY